MAGGSTIAGADSVTTVGLLAKRSFSSEISGSTTSSAAGSSAGSAVGSAAAVSPRSDACSGIDLVVLVAFFALFAFAFGCRRLDAWPPRLDGVDAAGLMVDVAKTGFGAMVESAVRCGEARCKLLLGTAGAQIYLFLFNFFGVVTDRVVKTAS